MQNELKNNVAGRQISVLGMARSGIAVTSLLKRNGAFPFVSDASPIEKLGDRPIELKNIGVEFETNGHTNHVFDADMIVVSPGIPSDAPVIVEAVKRGIKIFSELEVASWFCRAPIVAVTGTNGKTTTTTLIGKIFEEAKRKSVIGGNIGNAFSGFADQLQKDSTAVLEVSSFQLDYIKAFHPHVSLLLNITPDHLDRYDHNYQKYINSKCRIFENQTKDDSLIYNFDDQTVRDHVLKSKKIFVRAIPFGIKQNFKEGAFVENGRLFLKFGKTKTEIININEIKIRGLHNLYNSMAAVLAAHLMDVDTKVIKKTLKNFSGVEHRLELVRELRGIKYINDSKATNVDSVWYAVQAFNEPLVVLIGGRDKGNDYGKLIEPIKKYVKAIIAIGESSEKVRDAFAKIKPVVIASSMENAVDEANKIAVAGDIVLLSPACASFDWYTNYEFRGKNFKEIVNLLQ